MANIALIKVEQCAENSCELSLSRIELLLMCKAVHHKESLRAGESISLGIFIFLNPRPQGEDSSVNRLGDHMVSIIPS